MATFDKPDIARIQAAGLDALQGRGAVRDGRSAGELAGQFAAMLGQFASMLETIKGGQSTGPGTPLAALAGSAPDNPDAIRCAWPGLATLLAQSAPEIKLPPNSGVPPPPDVNALVAGSGPTTDFRWIAHLVGKSDTS